MVVIKQAFSETFCGGSDGNIFVDEAIFVTVGVAGCDGRTRKISGGKDNYVMNKPSLRWSRSDLFPTSATFTSSVPFPS